MATIIRVSDADFSQRSLGRSVWLTSNRDGLDGEYLIAGSQAASVINGANKSNPLTAVGAAPYTATSADLSQANWFDTNLLEARDNTFIVVTYALSVDSVLTGTFDGANAGSNNTFFLTGSKLTKNTTTTAGYQQLSYAYPAYAGWRFHAARDRGNADGSIDHAIDIFNGGARVGGASANVAAVTRAVSPVKIALGSSRGAANFPGPVTVSAALYYSRYLSDTELADVYQAVASTLSNLRGITV